MKKSTILLTALIIAGMTSCAVKDLRSKVIRKNGIMAQQRQKGKEILNEAIAVHGGDQWDEVESFSFQLYDQWNDPIGKSLAMPIKTNKTKSNWQVSKDLDLISILYLNGDHEGKEWGIDGDRVTTNSSNEISNKQQKKGAFYWRAIPYFMMTPFAFKNADVIFYMGEDHLKDGLVYDKVFISWGQDAPQKNIDQWVLYFDKKSHRLKYADHTLREMLKFMKATAEFSNYTHNSGILIPQKVDVKFNADGKFIGHEMSYSQITINNSGNQSRNALNKQ